MPETELYWVLEELTFEVIKWGYGASSAETKAEISKAKSQIKNLLDSAVKEAEIKTVIRLRDKQAEFIKAQYWSKNRGSGVTSEHTLEWLENELKTLKGNNDG